MVRGVTWRQAMASPLDPDSGTHPREPCPFALGMSVKEQSVGKCVIETDTV